MYIQSRQLQSPLPHKYIPLAYNIFPPWAHFSGLILSFVSFRWALLAFTWLLPFTLIFLLTEVFACSGNLEKFLQGSPFLCFFFVYFFQRPRVCCETPRLFILFLPAIAISFNSCTFLEGNEPRWQQKGEVKLLLRGVLLSVRAFIAFVSVS